MKRCKKCGGNKFQQLNSLSWCKDCGTTYADTHTAIDNLYKAVQKLAPPPPTPIEKNLPHFNVHALCLKPKIFSLKAFCGERWIGTVPAGTSLYSLQCPKCGAQDSFASFVPEGY